MLDHMDRMVGVGMITPDKIVRYSIGDFSVVIDVVMFHYCTQATASNANDSGQYLSIEWIRTSSSSLASEFVK